MLLRQLFEQQLNEAQLSDITIGFEIECVIDGDMIKVYNDLAKKYNVDGGSDSSIQPNTVYGNEIGMEFRIGALAEGGQMAATPANIMTCANFVHDIFKLGAYTNRTCGMHAHFGLGPITKMSTVESSWVAVMMLQSPLFEQLYTTYKGQNLYDNDYANVRTVKDSVDEIVHMAQQMKGEGEDKEEIVEYLFDNLFNRDEFEKYSALFPHGQGTLEWRGLRGVLNDKRQNINYETILGFFKLALSFARTVKMIMNKYNELSIAGVKMRDLQEHGASYGIEKQQEVKSNIIPLIKVSGLNNGMQKIFINHFSKQLQQPKYKKQYWARANSVFKNDLRFAAPVLNYFYDKFKQYDLSIKEDYLVSAEFPIVAKEFIRREDIVIDDIWRKGRDFGILLSFVFRHCNFIAKDLSFFENHGRMFFRVPTIDETNKIIVKDEKDEAKLDKVLAMVTPKNKRFMEVRRFVEIDPSKFTDI